MAGTKLDRSQVDIPGLDEALGLQSDYSDFKTNYNKRLDMLNLNQEYNISYSYEPVMNNITQETIADKNDIVLMSTEFSYDANGNIITETITQGTKIVVKNYLYDATNLLTSVTQRITNP